MMWQLPHTAGAAAAAADSGDGRTRRPASIGGQVRESVYLLDVSMQTTPTIDLAHTPRHIGAIYRVAASDDGAPYALFEVRLLRNVACASECSFVRGSWPFVHSSGIADVITPSRSLFFSGVVPRT